MAKICVGETEGLHMLHRLGLVSAEDRDVASDEERRFLPPSATEFKQRAISFHDERNEENKGSG